MKRPYSIYSDRELFLYLKGSKEESEAAFTELYNRYASRIHAYCYRVVGNTEQAEDIFQETFLRFYRSAQNERNMTNVPGYLLTIARNLCLNHKRDRRQTVSIDTLQFSAEEEHAQDKTELLELITMALELLEFEYREAFVLREYNGLSYAQIAEVVKTTVPTIKTRVFRAKQKIKAILTPYLKDLSE